MKMVLVHLSPNRLISEKQTNQMITWYKSVSAKVESGLLAALTKSRQRLSGMIGSFNWRKNFLMQLVIVWISKLDKLMRTKDKLFTLKFYKLK